MSYMIMLVMDNLDCADKVSSAWRAVQVEGIVFVDSTCSPTSGANVPHIPMRFLFENLGPDRRQCTITMFGIVADEECAQRCLEEAENVIGDLDGKEHTLFAAWPLTMVKGFAGCTLD